MNPQQYCRSRGHLHGRREGQREKCLNVTVHNVRESTCDEGQERKQHDIDEVNSIFQQYLGVTANIKRAARLGKKGTQPRLLMVQTGNKQEKAAVMRNCIKLRNENNPDKTRKVFIYLRIEKKTRLSGQNYPKETLYQETAYT